MLGKIECSSCGGTGNEPGISGTGPDGEVYTGSFPCGDCNGDGQQDAWFDSCAKCKGSGKTIDGIDCSRCNGLGFHEPAPSSKVSHWEIVEDF